MDETGHTAHKLSASRAALVGSGVLLSCAFAFVGLGSLLAWLFNLDLATVLLGLHLLAGAVALLLSLLLLLSFRFMPNDAWQRPVPPDDTADRITEALGRVLVAVELVSAGIAGPAAGWSLVLPSLHLLPGGALDRYSFISYAGPAIRVLLALIVAVAAISAFALAAGGRADGPAVWIFFCVFVANVWARQLQNLIGPASLSKALRAEVGSPQLHFAAVLVADAATLLVSLSALKHWGSLTDFQWPMLIDLLPSVIGPGGLASFFEVVAGSPVEALIVASGLLLGATMLKTVFDRGAFRRDASDYANLSLRALLRDDLDGAREWLSRTAETQPEVLMARCAYYLRTGNQEKALAAARQILKETKVEDDTDTALRQLSNALNFMRVNADLAERVTRLAVEKGASELTLVFYLTTFFRMGYATALMDRLQPDLRAYPLALSGLMLHSGRPEDALALLRGRTWERPFEQALQRSLLLYAKGGGFSGTKEQRDAGFARWVEEDWPVLHSVLPALGSEDEEKRKAILAELVHHERSARHRRSPILAEMVAARRDLAHTLAPNLANRLHAIFLGRLSRG